MAQETDGLFEVENLRKIRERYEYVVTLARESRCVCNASRSFADIAREILECLLKDDDLVGASAQVPVEFLSQHCPVHSPVLEKRPTWIGGCQEEGR